MNYYADVHEVSRKNDAVGITAGVQSSNIIKEFQINIRLWDNEYILAFWHINSLSSTGNAVMMMMHYQFRNPLNKNFLVMASLAFLGRNVICDN